MQEPKEANMHAAVQSTIRLGMFAFFSTVASAIFVARLFYAIQEQWLPELAPPDDHRPQD
jgi:hypothetical protein